MIPLSSLLLAFNPSSFLLLISFLFSSTVNDRNELFPTDAHKYELSMDHLKSETFYSLYQRHGFHVTNLYSYCFVKPTYTISNPEAVVIKNFVPFYQFDFTDVCFKVQLFSN